MIIDTADFLESYRGVLDATGPMAMTEIVSMVVTKMVSEAVPVIVVVPVVVLMWIGYGTELFGPICVNSFEWRKGAGERKEGRWLGAARRRSAGFLATSLGKTQEEDFGRFKVLIIRRGWFEEVCKVNLLRHFQMAGGKHSQALAGISSSHPEDDIFQFVEDELAYHRYRATQITPSRILNKEILNYQPLVPPLDLGPSYE
ncbi:hypothetical protein M5K25_027740 [Dendrobium thyrsiflorum]|uniref:Uncharacterized protein n=1 Tax=Dendrobium thyrsiflorum TaxID=117978 RepID=A0ABD0TUL6_DENTH